MKKLIFEVQASKWLQNGSNDPQAQMCVCVCVCVCVAPHAPQFSVFLVLSMSRHEVHLSAPHAPHCTSFSGFLYFEYVRIHYYQLPYNVPNTKKYIFF